MHELYKLKLGDGFCYVTTDGVRNKFFVTRVPGGWIFEYLAQKRRNFNKVGL